MPIQTASLYKAIEEFNNARKSYMIDAKSNDGNASESNYQKLSGAYDRVESFCDILGISLSNLTKWYRAINKCFHFKSHQSPLDLLLLHESEFSKILYSPTIHVHKWAEEDNQGNTMNCVKCGAHICIYDIDPIRWHILIDGECKS